MLHHHITKGLFTVDSFTQYFILAIEKKLQHILKSKKHNLKRQSKHQNHGKDFGIKYILLIHWSFGCSLMCILGIYFSINCFNQAVM